LDSFARIEGCVPALRRYAYALLRNRHDADDLVQDTLLRAIDRLHTRREDGNMRAWLFTILHHLFVSNRRRSLRRGVAEPLEAAEAVGAAARQDEALHARDLLQALSQLSPEQQQVVLLVGVEDLTYEQTADALGIPVGTVMSRLARRRERLRELDRGGGNNARIRLRRVK
jgi:RNA polymerase sigma-70 factor (ECF subfamily)